MVQEDAIRVQKIKEYVKSIKEYFDSVDDLGHLEEIVRKETAREILDGILDFIDSQ